MTAIGAALYNILQRADPPGILVDHDLLTSELAKQEVYHAHFAVLDRHLDLAFTMTIGRYGSERGIDVLGELHIQEFEVYCLMTACITAKHVLPNTYISIHKYMRYRTKAQ